MTTLGELAAGSKVKFGAFGGAPIIWIVGGHDIYSDGTTPLITKDIVALHAFDAKEASSSNSNRKSYGNNTWRYSNLKQWLNSDADAGQWYTAQHSVDVAPSSTSVVSQNPYSADKGFLNEFSANEKAALQDTTIQVTNYSGASTGFVSGSTDTVTSKIFLLTVANTGLSHSGSTGKQWPIFTDNNSRIAYYNGSATYWWNSDADTTLAYYVRDVDSGGSAGGNNAYNGGVGVRPACNLLSSISLSSTVDADGCYTIAYTEAFGIASAALAADAMPVGASISVSGSGLTNDNTTVEICNNANDATPTWEDCTAAAFAGTTYKFTNTVKTADAWAVAARANVISGQDGAYIDGMSGAFI